MIHIFSLAAGAAASILVSLTSPMGDKIPDFSRVGYRWGDKPVPTVKVVKTLEAPKDGSDASDLLQNAIESMTKPGAILLKAGTYNLSKTINLDRSGVVLRGEGDATVLRATGTSQRNLMVIGSGRQLAKSETRSAITDTYTPFGSDYIRVEDSGLFNPGDRILIFRPGSDKWIHDIHMDRIDEEFNNYGVAVENWQKSGWNMFFERIISRIDGDMLYLDGPVVMGMDVKYGKCLAISISWDKVSECGIENLVLESEYDPKPMKTVVWNYAEEEYHCDERHCMTGLQFLAAEHCWVRGVKSRYLGMSLVSLGSGAKNITVEDCHATEPVSIVEGSRRYAFNISSRSTMNLFKDCTCDHDRHCFVTNGPAQGPNVFVNCTATHAYSDAGPHMRWGMGTLYDNVVTDGPFRVQDRGASGHGHGIAGANIVLWNCEAENFVIQSPWATALNYAIGCIGPDGKPMLSGKRPDGVWVSRGTHVEPKSLYYDQLEARRKAKTPAVPKSCYK